MKLLLFLILLPFAFGKMIAPTIYEQNDFGPLSYNEFLYSMSVDCTAATVNAIIMDEEFKRVEGAATYLKYIDFAQPLISTVKSDKDGLVLHKLPGNVKLMRGFFILVIEKNGFRNKEVHFDIGKCWRNETPVINPPEPEPVEREPEIIPIESNNSPIVEDVVVEKEVESGDCLSILIPLIIFKMKAIDSIL